MSATTAAQRFAGQEDLVLMMLEHYLRILDGFSSWSREYRGHMAVVFPQAWSKLCFRTIGIRTIDAFGRSARLKLYLALAREIHDGTTESSIGTATKHSFNTPFVKAIRKNVWLGAKDFPKPRYLEAFLALCPSLTRLSFSHKVLYRDEKLLQHWLVEPSSLDGKRWKITISTLMLVTTVKDITKAAWAHTSPEKAYSSFEIAMRVTLHLKAYPEKIREWFTSSTGTPDGIRAIISSGFAMPMADLITASKARSQHGRPPILHIAAVCSRYTLDDLAELGKANPHLEVLEIGCESPDGGKQSLQARYFCDLADVLRVSFPSLRELKLSLARTESGVLQPVFCDTIPQYSPGSIHSQLKKVTIDGTFSPGTGALKDDPYAYALELACLGGLDCKYVLPKPSDSNVHRVLTYISQLSPSRQTTLLNTPASLFCPEATACPYQYMMERGYDEDYMRGVRWTESGRLLHLPTLKELKRIDECRKSLQGEWRAERRKLLDIIAPPRSTYFYDTPRKIALPDTSLGLKVEVYRHLGDYTANAHRALIEIDEEEEALLDGDYLDASCSSKIREGMCKAFEEDRAMLLQLEVQMKDHQDGSTASAAPSSG